MHLEHQEAVVTQQFGIKDSDSDHGDKKVLTHLWQSDRSGEYPTFSGGELRMGCSLFTFGYPSRNGTSLHQRPPVPFSPPSLLHSEKKNLFPPFRKTQKTSWLLISSPPQQKSC